MYRNASVCINTLYIFHNFFLRFINFNGKWPEYSTGVVVQIFVLASTCRANESDSGIERINCSGRRSTSRCNLLQARVLHWNWTYKDRPWKHIFSISFLPRATGSYMNLTLSSKVKTVLVISGWVNPFTVSHRFLDCYLIDVIIKNIIHSWFNVRDRDAFFIWNQVIRGFNVQVLVQVQQTAHRPDSTNLQKIPVAVDGFRCMRKCFCLLFLQLNTSEAMKYLVHQWPPHMHIPPWKPSAGTIAFKIFNNFTQCWYFGLWRCILFYELIVFFVSRTLLYKKIHGNFSSQVNVVE